VQTTKRCPSWRGLGRVTKFRNFRTPYNCGTNRNICFKFGTVIDDGPLLRSDHKTTPTWAWPGSRGQISKFWDPPYNFGTNRDIRFKFCTYIDDGPHRRVDHQMSPKWAWPESSDRISKFWDPLITFERIEQSASNLVQTYSKHPSCLWTIKTPL